MQLPEYVQNVSKRFSLGNATEHTFRGDLQQLLESMIPGIAATNEPKRQACGAPDYVITRKDLPIGYIEAKDIGVDLTGKNVKEQLDRYREALDNLIITDYLDFRLYHNGEFVASVRIAEIDGNKIVPLPENFDRFTSLINDFGRKITQSIKSSKKLAEMMADKAKLLAYIIQNALDSDEQSQENSTLQDQMRAFREILIHDIDSKSFADIYAQTIAYGMFAARLHDPTLETFTRQEAAENIPKTNPFLRKLFQYIAGYDLDDRIKWIVDALADIFRAADVAAILKNFGKATQTHDPIMHFYETFLAEYDPKLRKSRGVFYTPEPVVNFIVRAVDDILKTEFGLPDGLADTTKTKIKVDVQGKKVEKEVHKVQILDPATGTGTFLAEVIRHVHKSFEGQQGIWGHYVENELIPRLNGFEILMASYAMAHLKLDLLLSETGYKPSNEKRFQVYLTNALEEYHPDTGTLFASWLSAEANEANHIKRDTPVMVVIGNPPYSGESSNKGEWIMSLMEDYKKEPGGAEKLKERNPKWINDDYVKFIRYGQHFIEKNGEGILAFINPHGFLDNPTFRGMRWNLFRTFDKAYTVDLHGNSNKKETAPDGSTDENVFDIQQGVSINIFLRTSKKSDNSLCRAFHYDVFGRREEKYEFLVKNSLSTVDFIEVRYSAPQYYMVPKDFELQSKYDDGFAIYELFPTKSVGVVTANDSVLVAHDKTDLLRRVSDAYKIEVTGDIATSYSYRPFDDRYIYYLPEIIERPRTSVMQNMLHRKNLGLVACRQLGSGDWSHVGLVDRVMDDCRLSNRTKERGYIFPLYAINVHIDGNQQPLHNESLQSPNLNPEIVNKISEKIGLEFVTEKGGNPSGSEDVSSNAEYTLPTGRVSASIDEDPPNASGTLALQSFAPIDILDYIYAVLHSPAYRERYKEFLKIDFPRVPYPKDRETFWQLVRLGSELRELHLLESPTVSHFITGYPEPGSNAVERVAYDTGRVYINDTQYFSDVPETAWNFYIGGYQPAQKWLKDRKGRTLTYDDIRHYQKIIVALTETGRIMKAIDEVGFLEAEGPDTAN